jgi:hypothetical protein
VRKPGKLVVIKDQQAQFPRQERSAIFKEQKDL